MFRNTNSFNSPLRWNTSGWTDTALMFLKAYAFNQPLDWDMSKVTFLNGMFSYATSFNQPLGHVSSVVSMTRMFQGASSFSQDLSAWDVSSVTDFTDMFAGTRMASEAASGAHRTRPCMIHTAWKASLSVVPSIVGHQSNERSNVHSYLKLNKG